MGLVNEVVPAGKLMDRAREIALAQVQRSFVLVRELDGTLGGGAVKVYRSR